MGNHSTTLFLIIFCLCGIAGSCSLQAQPDAGFWSTMFDVVESSEEVSSGKHLYQSAAMMLSSARAARLPVIRIDADLPGITRQIEPILQDDGSQAFISRSLNYSAGFLSVSQHLPSTGTDIRISSGVFRTGSFSDDLVHWQSQPVSLRISQPIFRRSPLKDQLSTLELEMKREEANAEEVIRSQLIRLFQDWWMVQIDRLAVKEAALRVKQLDSLLAISTYLWEEGRRTYEDLSKIRQESGASKAMLHLQQARLSSKEEYFRVTWGRDWEKFGAWEGGVLPELPSLSSLHEWRLAAFQAGEMDYAIRVKELQISRLEQERLPEISIDGLLGLNQTGESLSEAYQEPLLSQYFSISLRHTLLDWGKHSAERDAQHHQLRSMMATQAAAHREAEARLGEAFILLTELRRVYHEQATLLHQAQDHAHWVLSQYQEGQAEVRAVFEAEAAVSLLSFQQGNLEAEYWQAWLTLILMNPSARSFLTSSP